MGKHARAVEDETNIPPKAIRFLWVAKAARVGKLANARATLSEVIRPMPVPILV